MLVSRPSVEDAVASEVWALDPESRLHADDFASIVGCVADRVCARMVHLTKDVVDDDDRAFIRRTSVRMVQIRLHPSPDRRFGTHDRVICHLSGRRAWAAGTIIELNRDDSDDPTGETQLPYLVRVDPPHSRIVCVPMDDNEIVRAEVCFAQDPDDLAFTLFSKPRKQNKMRRFGVGDRVACAVEDIADEIPWTWASGTVSEVNYDAHLEEARKKVGPLAPSWDWPSSDGIVPYRVLLDTGGHVLVHRDDHWLVRDLRLQPAGPPPLAGGRCLTRFARGGRVTTRGCGRRSRRTSSRGSSNSVRSPRCALRTGPVSTLHRA